MAIAAPTKQEEVLSPANDTPKPMTYEEYMAGPEEMARYDIVDGFKVYRLYGAKRMPNPTREHQKVQGNIFVALRDYEKQRKNSEALMAPCDVKVKERPLRTWQPDVLLISRERLAQNPPSDDPAPLSPAPELVVEILSPSDTRRVKGAKLKDYGLAGVAECWLVSLEAETVEVVRPVADADAVRVGLFGQGQDVESAAFEGLRVPVAHIFAGPEELSE